MMLDRSKHSAMIIGVEILTQSKKLREKHRTRTVFLLSVMTLRVPPLHEG